MADDKKTLHEVFTHEEIDEMSKLHKTVATALETNDDDSYATASNRLGQIMIAAARRNGIGVN